MKRLTLVLSILFSFNYFAYPEISYTSDDFNIFPLTSSSSRLIEGLWTGDSISLEIDRTNLAKDNKVYLWATITNLKTGELKSAILYYHGQHGRYELFVFGPNVSIPFEITIFNYSDLDAVERKMKCNQGGYIMKINFSLNNQEESETVQLQREMCTEK